MSAESPGYGPPQFAAPPSEPKGGNPALPWIIATVMAVLLAVAGFGWGFMQKNNADDAAQRSTAELAQAELEKSKAEFAKVEQKYQTKKNDLAGETSKLDELQAQYQKADKQAQATKATLKDQSQAAEAKAALATKCAQVMATGMRVIYDAETPDKVMSDVVKQMEKAAASCDAVVNVK